MAATAPKLVFSHITKNPKVCGGKACIDTTRIRVIDVVLAQSEGYTPDQIRSLFAVTLTLAQVYSALAYADEHRDEIDALYAELEALGEQIERDREKYLKGVSLSHAVAMLVEQLPGGPERTLSRWTRKLVGIAASGKGRKLSDEAIRRAHLDHLAEKHQ